MSAINVETVVMAGAALAAGANVDAQAQTQDNKTISWEDAQGMSKGEPIKDADGQTLAYFVEGQGAVYTVLPNEAQEATVKQYMDKVNESIHKQNEENVAKFQSSEAYKKLGEEEQILVTHKFRREYNQPYYLSGNDETLRGIEDKESPMRAFMQTEKYQKLAPADRIIAQGEFAKKVSPTVSDAISTQTFLALKYGMEKFDYTSAKVAADYMRGHFKDGYDERTVEKNVRNDLLIAHKSCSQENVEARMKLEEFGQKRWVDQNVTTNVIEAIDRDGKLSTVDKENLKLEELKNYCQRIDNEPQYTNEESRDRAKLPMLDKYPELATKLAAEKRQVQSEKGENIASMAMQKKMQSFHE